VIRAQRASTRASATVEFDGPPRDSAPSGNGSKRSHEERAGADGGGFDDDELEEAQMDEVVGGDDLFVPLYSKLSNNKYAYARVASLQPARL
jgi:hypothetical protein